jgi:hypothetical protein
MPGFFTFRHLENGAAAKFPIVSKKEQSNFPKALYIYRVKV